MARQSQSEIDEMIERSQYKNRDLVRRDINQVIQSPQCNLLLKLISHKLNDKQYICLYGTIRCQYKSNRYNIPIEIDINENHPYECPLCRLKPTSNMCITSNNINVQSDGTILINNLEKWRHPNSDLCKLINLISQSFSQSPPVYSISNINQQSILPYPIDNSLMPMPMPINYSNVNSLNEKKKDILENTSNDTIKTIIFNKIQRQFNEIIKIENEEINSLKKTEQSLNDGFKKIQLFIDQIQQQQNQIQNYITNIKPKMNEKPYLKKEYSIKEDLILIQSPIYKQFFQNFIEEHAIQDLLYYLADALRTKSISLDIYLKHLRQISRRQFILRATMIKCRQLAGLHIE